MTGNEAELPLSGVTVVSLEQAIAAPLASRHLADWGARVIKIERPGSGDFCRDYDHVMNGMSSQFVWTNRSKESLAIDIKSPEGRKVLDALLPRTDVFIQNLAPGAAERLGLDAASLTRKYPRLIACDVSGYGTDGPYSDKKAYDLLVQCEAGVLAINGTEAEPAKVGLSVVDIATGMYILNGVLMALYARERTGKGTAFQASLFDSITDWMSYPAFYTMSTGRPLPRTGAKHATIAPYGPFRVGDGNTIFFGIQNDREWRSLCRIVLDDAGFADDPRFRTNPLRMQNRDELQSHIEQRFASMTSEEVLRLLDEAAIANAHLNSVEAFLAHEQLHARARVRRVGSPCGPVMSFLPALTIPGVTPRMDPVPDVGEHNAKILGELGLGEGA
ncbi:MULTISPECIES: CaiB/BaiF CoA-transferase family protein [unclassified Bradyrhizobium]|uniref:CaiB/BaiF CoA transferase family protein n=1 Tax=unclassified Bradyrhizobium TaxID=2631580 RepID=UPI001CD3D90A|nr:MULTISPECIES: CaiB/BaiF CoA-transferase family protein [unclassified Bradyrhizobium]MCA1429358.1 CoA transferase [Bradyrhizobium sp. NBAIM16]MCA1508360.1 CoA transferase [Bradyrhizobium sp. NBAIM02]